MPEQAPTLRDMIQAVLDGGLTYRQLETRAVDPRTGKTASKDLFNNIIGGKVDRVPYDYHLRAIAVALAVPYERVRQAAIFQWIPPEPGSTAADIPEERRVQLIAEIQQLHDITSRVLAEAEGQGEGGAPAA